MRGSGRAVSPAKAEALMGKSFRENFDRETFNALLRSKMGGWQRGEHMVRCTENWAGDRTFIIRVAKRGREEIDVIHHISAKDFDATDPVQFVVLGELLAKVANEKVEAAYMELDDEWE